MHPFHISKNYPRLSYEFARRLELREKWANLLPFPQGQIIQVALTNIQLWTQLVNYISVPKARAIICTQETAPTPLTNGRSEANRGSSDEEDFYEVVDDSDVMEDFAIPELDPIPAPQALTLDQCLLSTKSNILVQFNEYQLSSPKEFATLDQAQHSASSFNSGTSSGQGVGGKETATRFTLHDDYDSNSPGSECPTERASKPKPEKSDLVDELSKLDFRSMPKTIPTSIDIADMYYDISLDRNSVEEFVKIQKLESIIAAKQRQLDLFKEKEAEFQARIKKTQTATQKPKAAVAEAAPGSPFFKMEGDSFKFLLGLLEEQKNSLPAPKDEIRALLEELSNDESLCPAGAGTKSGFFANLERIVQELIDYKEHSYPFLTPVQRKLVPDYHKKITHPMDLLTVSRKIKGQKYSTKKDFSSDLFLIYSNCRAYNIDKGNELTYHARAMEERTKQLLQALPDSFSLLTPDIPDLSATNTPSKPTPLVADLPSSPSQKDFGLDFGTAPQGSSISDSDTSHQAYINKLERDLASLNKSHLSLSASGSSSTDPRTGAYLDCTRDFRAQNELLRFSLVNGDFESAPTLFERDSTTLALPPTRKRLALGDLHSETGGKRVRQEDVLSMFPELATAGAVPSNPPPVPVNRPLLSDLAALKVPSSMATRQMVENISQIKRARELTDRIATAKDFIENPEESRPALHYLNTPLDAAPPNILLDPHGQAGKPELNQSTAHAMMKRLSAMILQHVGFESAEGRALELFTNLFEHQLRNLGQTIQTYISNHSATMSSEEILHHTLFENQVQGFAELEDYVTEGITKYGSKLRETGDKLRSKLEGLASRPRAEDDSEVEDGALAGNYEEFTGDDFFGFKALGLDVEHGLTSLSVPMRLLIGNKRKRSEAPVNGVVAAQEPDYTPPPAFSPLTDPKEVIGLLHDYYTNRLKEGAMVEDELLPNKKSNRPRVPPVGKHIAPARRRQAEQMAQAAEKKHKRAQETEARRLQKLIKLKEKEEKTAERKAKQQARNQQKEAEKENKRLLREEKKLRKQEAESRVLSKSTTTPATPSPDEERLSSSVQASSVTPASSPVSSTTTISSLTSTPSSTTSSNNDSVGMPIDKHRSFRRATLPRRDPGLKSNRPLGTKRPPRSDSIEGYSLPSSTSEGSFSGSASLSDDDLSHPGYHHTKPARWMPSAPPVNPRPSVPSTISNKPRKKPMRPADSLSSPAARNIKRKGPQK